MNDEQLDNIPILDELIKKGSSTEIPIDHDFESLIKDVIQRHTSQAVTEIMALMKSKET